MRKHLKPTSRKYISTFLCLVLIGCMAVDAVAMPCCEAPKPPATDTADNIADGLKYSQSKEYEQAMDSALARAHEVCEKHQGEPRVAIVSDIDETLLDNRPFYGKHANDFSFPEFFQWMQKSEAPVLPKTAELLAWARNNGYAIFLVTGRNESMRAATIVNLVKNKVAYDGLFMRKNDDNGLAEDFKANARKQIEDSGFNIVVNIGDQLSDLYGGHADECIKLPNQMYYIP